MATGRVHSRLDVRGSAPYRTGAHTMKLYEVEVRFVVECRNPEEAFYLVDYGLGALPVGESIGEGFHSWVMLEDCVTDVTDEYPESDRLLESAAELQAVKAEQGFDAGDDAEEEEDDGWDEADRRYKRRPAPYLHRPL